MLGMTDLFHKIACFRKKCVRRMRRCIFEKHQCFRFFWFGELTLTRLKVSPIRNIVEILLGDVLELYGILHLSRRGFCVCVRDFQAILLYGISSRACKMDDTHFHNEGSAVLEPLHTK